MEGNTEAFIYEIERRPSIWDYGSSDYANKVIKRNDWESVILKFCPDFVQKDESDKKVIVSNFQRKWKSLRDSFSRELAKQRKEKFICESGRKQYMFFDQLRFLGTVVKPTSSTLIDDTVLWMEKEIQDVEDKVIENVTPIKKVRKRKKNNVNKGSTLPEEIANTQNASHTYNQPLQDNMKDEDTLFMLSLVPELKKLPEYIKLETKGELLNVLKKARFQYGSSPHIPTVQTNALYGYQPQELYQNNQPFQNTNIEYSQHKKRCTKKGSTSADSILETDLVL